MSSITLRRIRSFIAVADLGGFRKAAEELAVSQPLLSAHVRELEEQLGMRLLRRTTRNIQLTESGAVFLARVRRALEDLESIIGEMKEKATTQRGRAIVASVPSIAANALPNILSNFKKQHPEISVEVCDERTEAIETRVRRGEVDFAISPPTDHASELEFEHIVDDPYVAVFPRTHELAQGRTVTLRRFSMYPLILMRPKQNMRHVLDAAAAKAGIVLRPAHEVYHHDTLTGMVASGLGIGALPRLTMSIIRDSRLAVARITEPRIARSIGILKRRGEPLAPAAQKLMDATRSHLLAAIREPEAGRVAGRPRKRRTTTEGAKL